MGQLPSHCSSQRKGHPREWSTYKGLKMVCAVVCLNSFSGEVPSSKIVLVGILFENGLQKSHHAYAVVDDKSNTFMISLDLANK